MNKVFLMRAAVGTALFGLGVATGLVAQPTYDSPERQELKRTDLSGAPGMEVILSVAKYMPGSSIPLHLHHGVEAGYVLKGSSIQPPGKDAMPLPTGATVMNLRDVRHGGFKIVGE